MEKLRPFLWVAFAVAGAVLLVWGLQPNGQSGAGSAGTNTLDTAADFELPDRSGNTVRLADLRGTPVFINFWATWCAPCKAELPMLAQLYREHNEEIHFLFVSVDHEGWEVINRFLEQEGLDIPVLLDQDMQVSDLYGVRGWPTTFFLDAEHHIIRRPVEGMLEEQFTRDMIAQVLGQGATTTAAP